MRNRLSWDQVQAPDLGTSLEALKAGASQLDRALGQGIKLTNDIDNQQTASVNKEFALKLAQFDNPDALREALAADPTLGLDAKRANVAMGAERVTGLLGLDRSTIQNKDAAGDLAEEGRVRENAARRLKGAQAATPVINEYVTALNSGDQAAAAAIRNDPNKWGLIQGLDADQYQDVLKGGNGFLDDNLQRERGITGDKRGQISWDQEQLSYKEGRDATALFESAQSNAWDQDSVLAYFNDPNNTKGYSPTVISAARGKALALIGGLTPAGGAGGGSGGGAGGGASPAVGSGVYSVVLGNRGDGTNAYGITPPKPIDTMTMGEAFDFGRSVMIPKTKALGVGKDPKTGQVLGSSALGAYQIVGSTMSRYASQLYGPNWRSQTFDAATQDKIAEAIFNDIPKGADLHGVWEGIPAGRKKGDMTWQEARGLIISKESAGSVNPREVAASSQRQANGIAFNNANNPDLGIAQSFVEVSQDFKTKPRQAAAKLVADGGVLAGEDIGDVTGVITSIMKSEGIKSAPLAAEILAASAEGDKGFWRKVGGMVSFGAGTDGLNAGINYSEVRRLANIAKNKDLMTDAVRTLQVGPQATQEAQAAIQALTTARANYAAQQRTMAARGITNPRALSGPAAALRQAEADAIAAGVNLQGLNQAGDPNPPAPTPPPTVRRTAPPPGAKPQPQRGGAARASQMMGLPQQQGPAWAQQNGKGLIFKR